MIDNKSVLAVIPARAGSKRVPLKNIKDYRGKSLLEWAIMSAKGSRYIDHIVVSSDSRRILEIARTIPGTVCAERPEWLATDFAMNEGVLIHTLYTVQWADWVVLLQPTSPLRTPEDIDTCIERCQYGRGCITHNEAGRRNGAVYVTRSTELVASSKFDEQIFDQFLIMPNERSLDIDYAVDFEN